MTIDELKKKLSASPDTLDFDEVISLIDSTYNFSPAAFTNGDLKNEAGQNNGSCKLFAFANLHDFNQQETLNCFGQYYRDVLDKPDGDDHQNIRNFMQSGWKGISFKALPLTKK